MKKFFREEYTKIREMSFAEKKWYIWEYYKIHIFVLAAVVILVGSVINIWLNPGPQDYLYIAWRNVPATEQQLEKLEELLSEIVTDEGSQIRITNYSHSENSQTNMILQTRFSSLFHAGNIDLFITVRDGVPENMHFFRQLDEVLGYLERISPRTRNLLEGRLYSPKNFSNEEEALQDIQYIAISLGGLPALDELGLGQDIYLGIILNSQNFYAIAKALEVLFYGA